MTTFERLRKSKKLRLRNIAEQIGISPQAVWNHEKHGIKTIRVAKRYAAVLGCNPLELLEE